MRGVLGFRSSGKGLLGGKGGAGAAPGPELRDARGAGGQIWAVRVAVVSETREDQLPSP